MREDELVLALSPQRDRLLFGVSCCRPSCLPFVPPRLELLALRYGAGSPEAYLKAVTDTASRSGISFHILNNSPFLCCPNLQCGGILLVFTV